ncbi:T9SS C-terminal target domain-containing protein [Chryseobacterium sp. G0240]|uniref:T9SS type A sorting domain-containing protein n=1 Tax=Chryseobacterium sp. G0240 TaxID=2487066 RepID=UPI000F44FFCB|nr:T9SS type A sorting domain-containing protein [Chryseobacterium sp. G0240]ROI01179.1 T9SS C-terminal target domain-containing protein [Chryseobacterium sp. G0240]
MKKIIILLAASMQSLVSANYSHAEKEREINRLSISRLTNNPNISALSIPFFESEYYAYVYSSGTLVVPYSGGAYPNMSIASQGITGLTATTQAGAGGNITFNISGFASGVGTAYFFTVVNNQPIQFQVTVKEAPSDARVASLDCSSSNATGTFSANTPSVGSKDVLYTGGNGLPYFQQKIISTGVTGLTAVLNAGTLNSGNSVPGKLTYQITGIPSSAGKAYFTVVFGGQNCSFSVDVNDATGRVLDLNCSATEATGTFSAGNNSSGTKEVQYVSGNGKPYAAQVVESTGVTGLKAVLSSGVLNFGDGSVTYQISGVPASSGVASFIARIGDKNCTFSVNVGIDPSIASLNCAGPLSGTYRKNNYTSNGAKTISYESNTASSYDKITINSTGVQGLTAVAQAGTLNQGSGTITFKITGTPQSNGTATFNVKLGNKTCSFTINVEDEILDPNCFSAEEFGYNISENPSAPTTLMIGGEEVKVYRKTANRSTYPSCYSGWGQTQSGVTMANACARFRMGYYYVNKMTLVFDKPVNNIGFKSTWYTNNDSAIITTNGGGTLEMKGIVGNASLIVNNKGSYLKTAGNSASGNNMGIAYIVSSTQPYTELTLSYDTYGDDILAAFSRCSARVENNITDEMTFSKGTVSANKNVTVNNILDLDKKTAEQVKLFPNPATSYIKISGLKGKGSYQIFNQGGRPVANGTVSEDTAVDVSTLAQGVYIMSIDDTTGKHDFKFLKK